MRASELIGLPVVGPDGRSLGRVLDLRVVQDGPLRGAYAAMRLDALVVGRHMLAAHLGYDRGTVSGPWLLAALARWLTRSNSLLMWTDARVEDGVVHSGRSTLERVTATTTPRSGS